MLLIPCTLMYAIRSASVSTTVNVSPFAEAWFGTYILPLVTDADTKLEYMGPSAKLCKSIRMAIFALMSIFI